MACNQSDCLVRSVELAPRQPGDDARVVLKEVEAPEGAAPDVGANGNRDALEEKVRNQIDRANREDCPEGCACVADEEAKPKVKVHTVPATATYRPAGAKPGDPLKRVTGTVRIRQTDQPGACFDEAEKISDAGLEQEVALKY